MVKKILVGISGASGFNYGVRILERLKTQKNIETHLIISKSALLVHANECEKPLKEVKALADQIHPHNDIGCACASGSFLMDGMIVAPCSMRSLGEIANGIASNALTRSADVMLKERRRLVLMVRETPLNKAHLQNMLSITEMGGIIAPPVPALYNKPSTIDDLIEHSVGRVLDLFDIHLDAVKRWPA